jgi:hypothetical protein
VVEFEANIVIGFAMITNFRTNGKEELAENNRYTKCVQMKEGKLEV